MRMIASAAALLLGLLAAGCNGEVVGGGQRPAAVLVVSGDLQTGTAGQELPQPLVVRVVDDAGRPVRNQLVNFRVTRGGGSVFAGSAITNRDGIAQERWTLGVVADTQQVEARAVDPETGVGVVFATFRAVAVPAAPAAVTPVGPAARQGTAGAALADSLAVRVTDANGNPVPGAAVIWTVQSGGGAIAPATGTTGADGTARAAWTLGPRVDSAQSVQAAVAGATAATFTATAAVPADVVLEKVSGDNQSAPNGTTLPDSLVVRARLTDGRPLRGVVINWQAAIDAQISPPQSVTDAQGLTRAAWRLGPNGGGSASATVNGTETQVRFLATGIPPARDYYTVSAGQAHACAVAEGGMTYCWGRNTTGQLGTGDTQSRTSPAQVATSVTFASVEAGGSHTCGLTAAGQAYCWGSNARGQLGTGAVGGSSDTPAPVAGGHAFASLTAGASHTCGRTTAGTVRCWGRNDAGELGDGSTTDRGTPTAIASVTGGDAFVSLSAGDRHTCGAVLAAGATPVAVYRVYCWGSNDAGQLRTFTGAFSPTPVVSVDREFLQRPVAVASGGSHSCAISRSASNPDCWGSNSAGQRGSGISTLYTGLTAGGEHTCGFTGGTLTCWGSNASGQLGNPAGGGGTPVPVTSPGREFVQVDGGGAFTCARAASFFTLAFGFVYCWGSDAEGQLGNGAAAGSSPTPVRVP